MNSTLDKAGPVENIVKYIDTLIEYLSIKEFPYPTFYPTWVFFSISMM